MIKHNKKKNAGIVYEQLMTLMATLLSENKNEEVAFVKKIILKHYSKNSNLLKEKKLFDGLLSFKTKENDLAEKFLGESLAESALIDMNILDKEKVSLINEIVSSIGQELFSIPVKNYKLFATTQFLLNETRNSFKYSTVEERLKLKTSLIENIKKSIEKTENDKIDGLTLRLLKNKYIKKYSALLNDNQQLIIARYNNYLNSNNGKDMISFLKEEFNKIYKNIHSFVAINQDHENASLLKEACQKIKSLQIKEINDDIVYEAMRYWDVVEDLKLEESQNV